MVGFALDRAVELGPQSAEYFLSAAQARLRRGQV
jgi:hypothetical protein